VHYLVGFLGVFALGIVALTGCGGSSTAATGSSGAGGNGGISGNGGIGGIAGNGGKDGVFACTEQGIRDAISEGGGPHLFACNGPTLVPTDAEIAIDNNVVLDGRGDLTVDGGSSHRLFSVPEGVTAELREFRVVGGATRDGENGGGILNRGVFTLTNSTVSGNKAGGVGGGIHSDGLLTVTNSTVSGNSAANGGGIHVGSEIAVGSASLYNSTVSENVAENGFGGGVRVWRGTLALTSTTVSGNIGTTGSAISLQALESTATLTNSLVDGQCFDLQPGVTSLGHNIESPGNSCGFDQGTDQVNVRAQDLNLGALQQNGGPTETHALQSGSVAIDDVPQAECLDADGEASTTDQRGEPRPEAVASLCDVGAFEAQP